MYLPIRWWSKTSYGLYRPTANDGRLIQKTKIIETKDKYPTKAESL